MSNGVEFMSCSAIATVFKPEPVAGLNYESVYFCRYNGQTSGSSPITFSGYFQNYIQSKYPPFYTQSQRGYLVPCFYADGRDNFKEHYSGWLRNDNGYYSMSDFAIFDRLTYPNDLTKQMWHVIWQQTDEEEEHYGEVSCDGVYEQDWGSDPDWEFSYKAYHGYKCRMTGTFVIYDKNSSWHVPSGTNYERDCRANMLTVNITTTGGILQTNNRDFDYRIFNGENFQSGADWLSWCKAH